LGKILQRAGTECETIQPSPEAQGGNVEKQLATAAYWIGIVSTVLALIMRMLAWVGVLAVEPGIRGGRYFPLSYRTFLEGAVLFFVMAVASTALAWVKERKA
jgi:hypothetical protein